MQLLGSDPSPVVVAGVGVASSLLFVVVGVGVASSSSSILVRLCTFRIVLCRRWPRVWRWVRWRGLAVERHWPVDGSGFALVGWVSSRHLWWSWVVFEGAGRRLRVAVCFESSFCRCWTVVVIRWLVVVVLERLASCEGVGFVYHYMGLTWW